MLASIPTEIPPTISIPPASPFPPPSSMHMDKIIADILAIPCAPQITPTAPPKIRIPLQRQVDFIAETLYGILTRDVRTTTIYVDATMRRIILATLAECVAAIAANKRAPDPQRGAIRSAWHFYKKFGDKRIAETNINQYSINTSCTHPLQWKLIAFLAHLTNIRYNMVSFFIPLYQRAVKYGDIDCYYIMATYYTKRHNKSSAKECAMIGSNLGQLDCALLAAQHYITAVPPDLRSALSLLLQLADAKHDGGCQYFARHCFRFYHYLPQLRLHMAVRTNAIPELTLFLRSRRIDPATIVGFASSLTIDAPQCCVCYHTKSAELYYHDCLLHIVCIDCYCATTTTCPMCRFNLPTIHRTLLRCQRGPTISGTVTGASQPQQIFFDDDDGDDDDEPST